MLHRQILSVFFVASLFVSMVGCGPGSTPEAPAKGELQDFLDNNPDVAAEEEAELESEDTQFEAAGESE